MKQRKPVKIQKGMHCAYCGLFSREIQREHVIGHTIFHPLIVDGIDINPIIVPSCPSCNLDKSKDETYVSIMLSLASDKRLTPKQNKGINRLPFKEKQSLVNAKVIWPEINGVVQKKMSVSFNIAKFEKICMYMGKGIIYNHNGGKPINTNYNNFKFSMLPTDAEFDVKVLLNLYRLGEPESVFHDDGYYGEQIRYIVIIGEKEDMVLFKIFDPIIFTLQDNKISKIFMVSLTKNKIKL